ncbi:MAG TPA: hypothetical protein VHM25_02755 [Polyangiaceae bacterium]|nr:hypothetical protein [Polyangiaceae bacterium]
MIGLLGLVALVYGAYALWRRQKPLLLHAVLPLLAAVALLGAEVYAQLRPEPPPAVTIRLSDAERRTMQLQLAQSELRAAGFALPRGAVDQVLAADGDFTARITPEGDTFRLELSGQPPLEGLTLEQAVAKVRETHRPAR